MDIRFSFDEADVAVQSRDLAVPGDIFKSVGARLDMEKSELRLPTGAEAVEGAGRDLFRSAEGRLRFDDPFASLQAEEICRIDFPELHAVLFLAFQ